MCGAFFCLIQTKVYRSFTHSSTDSWSNENKESESANDGWLWAMHIHMNKQKTKYPFLFVRLVRVDSALALNVLEIRLFHRISKQSAWMIYSIRFWTPQFSNNLKKTQHTRRYIWSQKKWDFVSSVQFVFQKQKEIQMCSAQNVFRNTIIKRKVCICATLLQFQNQVRKLQCEYRMHHTFGHMFRFSCFWWKSNFHCRIGQIEWNGWEAIWLTKNGNRA